MPVQAVSGLSGESKRSTKTPGMLRTYKSQGIAKRGL